MENVSLAQGHTLAEADLDMTKVTDTVGWLSV